MRIFLLTFIVFCNSIVFGQKKYSLTFSNDEYSSIKKNYTSTFKDSLEAKRYLREFQLYAIKQGFLTASVDTIKYLPNQLVAYFFRGPKFGKAFLKIEKTEIFFFKKHMRINEKLITNMPFSSLQLSSLLRKLQDVLENEGYPFAKVFLDSISMVDEDLHAIIRVQKNQYYKWNAIHVKGDSAVSKVALMNIIRIKPGEKYSQDELRLISKRIKQVNYLKEIKQHEILFTKDGAELFLYVKSNAVSSVNGAIGLQPNPISNKLNLTGDIALKLLNVIRKGELLEFNWKSIQAQTQSLRAHVNYPFILKSPFGVDALFSLYKRDSSYLETKANLGIQYFLKGGNYFKVFYQNDASSVLSGGKNNPSFSNLNTVQTNSYGLAVLKKQVDYLPNPSKGIIFNTEIAIGNRKSISKIDSANLKSTTYRADLNIEFFIPLHKRHVLRVANQTSCYYAPSVFQNEVFRFGGLTIQRGFNEEELYATTKSTLSVEYRYLVDQNSRVFAFFDQSWYENNAVKYFNDMPFGFGFGFSFGTNLGIFSISYAQGKQFDNPILIQNGKVHFGYVAYF
jgi:outer membrane protein assembly factor BamA